MGVLTRRKTDPASHLPACPTLTSTRVHQLAAIGDAKLGSFALNAAGGLLAPLAPPRHPATPITTDRFGDPSSLRLLLIEADFIQKNRLTVFSSLLDVVVGTLVAVSR